MKVSIALIAVAALALTGCGAINGAKQDVAAASSLLGGLRDALKPEPVPAPESPAASPLGPVKTHTPVPQNEK